ncbi:MAG: helix-turn-helix transcriptional regulator [bacterium]
MNRIDRLVAIILLMQSRKLIRACDIAEHFEISTRTVYRDMNALCEAGVPVAAEAGEGYSLVEGYHLPPIMFTPEEASALFTGGTFVEHLTDASIRKHAESALLKIRSVLPATTQDYLEKLQASTAVYARPPGNSNGFRDDVLVTIQDALVHRNLLTLEYYSNYRETFSKRDIEPLGLLYYGNHWHLIAYCRLRQDYRDFRTDRIRSIRAKEQTFASRAGFSLKNYLLHFESFENPIEVKVKFDSRIVSHVRERNAYGLVNEEQVADGVIMTFLTDNPNWMVHWLISYSTHAEIISPDSLRTALLQEAQKLIEHYKTS